MVRSPRERFGLPLLARQPFPTFLILDVYGFQNSFEIAYKAYLAFRDEIATTHYVRLPNVQTYLREELSAAYQFLNAHPHLWEFCGPHLAGAVKGRQSAVRDGTRLRFRQAVKAVARPDPSGPTGVADVPLAYSRTAALAWCVLVESALLTDRLQQDTREQATAEQVPLPMAGHWLPYFLPCPPPEARAAFNDDVKYRWPVRVFALDPYTQEQNLADRLATRREVRLALSRAFVSGRVNFNQMNRFARRLEAEYETVDLNRTPVGFGHGENTFGWRFYPRFQTPDTPGNPTLIGRDLFVGGPKAAYALVAVNESLAVAWTPADPAAPAAGTYKVEPVFADLVSADGVKVGPFTIPTPCEVTATASVKELTIPGDGVRRIAHELLQKLVDVRVPEAQWAGGVKTSEVVLTPVIAGAVGRPVSPNDPLVVEFARVEYRGAEITPKDGPKADAPPPKDPAPAKPAAPAEDRRRRQDRPGRGGVGAGPEVRVQHLRGLARQAVTGGLRVAARGFGCEAASGTPVTPPRNSSLDPPAKSDGIWCDPGAGRPAPPGCRATEPPGPPRPAPP